MHRRIRHWHIIRNEPYRLFFPVGIVLSIVGTTQWILFPLGLLDIYPATLHAFQQVEGFIMCFAVGFLLTALPKFFDAPPCTTLEFVAIVILMLALLTTLMAARVVAAQWSFLAVILFMITFAIRRLRTATSRPPETATYIPFGLLHAAVGGWMVLHPHESFPLVGERMIHQGFLLCLIMGIGSFLGPRLLGLVAQGTMITPSSLRNSMGPQRTRRQITYAGLAILVLVSFWIETAGFYRVGVSLRAAAVATQLLGLAGMWQFPRNRAPHLYLLFASMWSLPIGLMLSAWLPAFRVALLHIVFIGGFGAITLIIGMRVTMAHGGIMELWQKNSPQILTLCALIVAALMLRILANAITQLYLPLLMCGAVCWVAASLLWLIWLFPLFFQEPHELVV